MTKKLKKSGGHNILSEKFIKDYMLDVDWSLIKKHKPFKDFSKRELDRWKKMKIVWGKRTTTSK